ncbi:MAG: hypothetical protein ACOY90_09180 [Candidatus Zhuqueibacterota bacterium]
MWGDKSISEFNFLKYSDSEWEFWAGNDISYVNRLSWIFYFQLSKLYDLEVVSFEGQNYKKQKYFSINMIHKDIEKKYLEPVAQLEDLIKYQRGIFVIGHNQKSDILIN